MRSRHPAAFNRLRDIATAGKNKVTLWIF